ncbi:DUF72 domain-containing protein [Conexibacter sp. SYSU D00693]|uniref:DUF72 domain-containing protein n=1 Tax=Conexibacter sp. SYSU D00693 TaxID=2812560 RepID=UPI00196ABCAB|nr:DUF72 domain-containing protein [Conexibacter sp. SYSU D00693]
MGDLRIGCSGWSYRSWKGVLYAPKLPTSRWLARYAEVFDTVEVNSTFYRLAKPEAVANWLEQTPADFLFTVKASRFLTHMKRLTDMEQGVERFYAAIAPLVGHPKMGPVLWQLPESFRKDVPRLAACLDALPEGRHCFEFRHESWFCDEVLELLHWHGVGLVIGEHPDRPFQPVVTTADFTLVRFHFGHRGRRGNYSRTELEAWAPKLLELAEDHDVLVYFNNDWEGFAVRNAKLLQQLTGATLRSPPRGGAVW